MGAPIRQGAFIREGCLTHHFLLGQLWYWHNNKGFFPIMMGEMWGGGEVGYGGGVWVIGMGSWVYTIKLVLLSP